MSSNILNTAEEYLNAWSRKDVEAISKYVDPNIRFVGPMMQTTGKEAFLEGARRVLGLLKEIKLRAKFAAGEQALLTYDFICAEPIGNCRTAELITFKNGLISGVELFFDARPFERMRQEQKREVKTA